MLSNPIYFFTQRWSTALSQHRWFSTFSEHQNYPRKLLRIHQRMAPLPRHWFNLTGSGPGMSILSDSNGQLTQGLCTNLTLPMAHDFWPIIFFLLEMCKLGNYIPLVEMGKKDWASCWWRECWSSGHHGYVWVSSMSNTSCERAGRGWWTVQGGGSNERDVIIHWQKLARPSGTSSSHCQCTGGWAWSPWNEV